MAHSVTTLDGLGDGVFRKLRPALGVTAFGVNALVLPPGTAWFEHWHETQDELYFVHAGRVGFEVDGEQYELGSGGAVHVVSTTPRKFWNAGDEELVLLVVGGKGGYVERDGHIDDPDELDRRRRFSDGDLDAIRRA